MTPDDRSVCDGLWRQLGEPWVEAMAWREDVPRWVSAGRVRLPVHRAPVHLGALPDWTDAGTVGILLGMARTAWALPDLTTCAGGERDGSISWEVESIDPRDFSGFRQHSRGTTEPEALLRAILAGRAR